MRVVAIAALFLLALAALAVVPSASAMTIPPPCQYCAPPRCPGLDTVGVIAQVARVVVDQDCNVHVILLQVVACAHPLDGEWVATEGRLTVSAPCKPNFRPCEPPFECAPESAPATIPPCQCAPPPPVCQPIVRAITGNDFESISDYCDVTVTLQAYCGLQGTPEDHQVKAPKVTVNYQTCKSPPPQVSTATNPFPTCIRDCSPLPDQACALRDATPSPLVHPIWGYDCTLDIETSCVNGYGSGHTDTRVGFLNVRLEQCGGMPPPAWS